MNTTCPNKISSIPRPYQITDKEEYKGSSCELGNFFFLSAQNVEPAQQIQRSAENVDVS